MLAKACSCAVIGLEGALVEVEVDIGHGLPAFTIVGLPDAAVNEAKERVRAAIKNSGGIFPLRRITVNLAPADLRKAGPAYDLPIAVAILMASEQVAAAERDRRDRRRGGCALPGRAEPGRRPAPYPWHPADGRAGARPGHRGASTSRRWTRRRRRWSRRSTVYPGRASLAQLVAHLRGDAAHRAVRARCARCWSRRTMSRVPLRPGRCARAGACQARAGGGGGWRP